MRFCSLYSGSSGNALFIATDRTKLLLDAGLSGKKIVNALELIGEDPATLSAIIVTHEHTDHSHGVGILARKLKVPVYATGGTWKGMEWTVGKIVPELQHRFRLDRDFEIGDVAIHPFPIPHDAAEPVGMSFFADGRKLTIATDIGHLNKQLLECIGGSDLLLIESNHDVEMLKRGPYSDYLKARILGAYGHLSNESAGEAIVRAVHSGTRHVLLGHLSGENNTPYLAYGCAEKTLKQEGVEIGKDVFLNVAQRGQVGQMIRLG